MQCQTLLTMNDEKKYPPIEEETGNQDMANEPLVSSTIQTKATTIVDCNFGHTDFGYPHTVEELNAALDEAEAQRNDPTKWISSVEFHSRLEKKYPWLS